MSETEPRVCTMCPNGERAIVALRCVANAEVLDAEAVRAAFTGHGELPAIPPERLDAFLCASCLVRIYLLGKRHDLDHRTSGQFLGDLAGVPTTKTNPD